MAEGREDLACGLSPSQTLGEYLAERDYTARFRTEFLYPTLSSTVCTCSYRGLDQYPARVVLETLRCLTDDRALQRTRYGTRDVVNRLTASLSDVRMNHAVTALYDQGDHVCVISADGSREQFDHVIVATQANTALSLQPELPYFEREVLGSIPYQDVYVVVHRDEQLMPPQKQDWQTFNMLVHQSGPAVERATCTVWLNRFDSRCRGLPNMFQTISPAVEPSASKVLARIRLQRPAVNIRSMHEIAMLEDMHELLGRRIWYCGSWAAAGVPLLETAVISARRAAETILQSRSPTSA
jgi:predicted NAD/FAD-binding protein